MKFQKGNRYAQGNENSGRPAFYTDPEEFKRIAEEYLETTKNTTGAYKPTLTGLCFHLGFESLQSFYDYEEKPVFTYTIRRLRLFVQSCYEQQLYGFAWAGSSFALKNLAKKDWKDEITEHSDKKVTHVTITTKKRDED